MIQNLCGKIQMSIVCFSAHSMIIIATSKSTIKAHYKMIVVPKLIVDNPELLLYLDGKLNITILGGIRLTGFDRLKVTLKIVSGSNANAAFRHNLDLYNSIQAEQLVEKAAEALDSCCRTG
jgi:hypothetical protein